MRSESIYRLPKRALDLCVSVALFILLLPVALTAVISIWCHDGGQPFYSQVRVGRDGRRFRMWKLRTMTTDADARRAALVQGSETIRFKLRDDPRITPVGRVLRRLSLDEVPQLFNVLRGDMSLVGPRPPLPEEVDGYSDIELRRLEATPGLTGPWQVSGRSEIGFEEQVQLDLEYVERRTFWGDVKLLFQTVPAVLSGRGAW